MSGGRGEPATLTVVVPVYNVERYLPACLDSLLEQTRAIDEIIAVDDSTDACPRILAEYSARHPALRAVRGPGRDVNAARNLGLDLARGQWLAFVDADDMVEPRMYERLTALAARHDLDMALCNARQHFGGRRPDQRLYTDSPPAGPMSGAQWLTCKLERRSFLHAVWMHLYRRDFIERHAMRFIDGLLHEDVTWTTRALVLAARVAYDDEPLYVYRSAEVDADAPGPAPSEAAIGSRTMAYVRRNAARIAPAVMDRRVVRVIEGAKTNARFVADLAAAAADARLARALRWQLVDGGLALFQKIRQLSTPALRREQWREALHDGYLRLLWTNAVETRQRRKIAARYVRALLAAAFSPARGSAG